MKLTYDQSFCTLFHANQIVLIPNIYGLFKCLMCAENVLDILFCFSGLK